MAPKTVDILKALSIFKFLSRKQMTVLGLGRHSSEFSWHLIPLSKAKIIGKIDATSYGLGHIYYLTRKGAKYISNQLNKNLNEIHFCLNKPTLSPHTILHRTYAIDA